jgi:hypothetical protein
VRQDIRLLVQYKRRLLQKILNKLQILKEMNYFEPNEENESFSSLFTKVRTENIFQTERERERKREKERERKRKRKGERVLIFLTIDLFCGLCLVSSEIT